MNLEALIIPALLAGALEGLLHYMRRVHGWHMREPWTYVWGVLAATTCPAGYGVLADDWTPLVVFTVTFCACGVVVGLAYLVLWIQSLIAAAVEKGMKEQAEQDNAGHYTGA